jgi:hypothetical protein
MLVLRMGGSAWEVTDTADGQWQLTRRALGPIREAIEDTRTSSERAHAHLVKAWSELAGRDPDPGSAYREAVRAVECVAKPVISPNNATATLGTMLREMRDKPEKWRFVLGSTETVADMCETLWRGQPDRHGTDDETAPMHASPEEADAAVHLAIALVRFFAGELIRPA